MVRAGPCRVLTPTRCLRSSISPRKEACSPITASDCRHRPPKGPFPPGSPGTRGPPGSPVPGDHLDHRCQGITWITGAQGTTWITGAQGTTPLKDIGTSPGYGAPSRRVQRRSTCERSGERHPRLRWEHRTARWLGPVACTRSCAPGRRSRPHTWRPGRAAAKNSPTHSVSDTTRVPAAQKSEGPSPTLEPSVVDPSQALDESFVARLWATAKFFGGRDLSHGRPALRHLRPLRGGVLLVPLV